MSWKSGGDLYQDIFEMIDEFVQPVNKVQAYKVLIREFYKKDFDNVFEYQGQSQAYDKALKQIFPEHFEEIEREANES